MGKPAKPKNQPAASAPVIAPDPAAAFDVLASATVDEQPVDAPAPAPAAKQPKQARSDRGQSLTKIPSKHRKFAKGT